MADTPLSCPYCGAKPPVPRRNWLGFTAVAATVFAVAVATNAAVRALGEARTQAIATHEDVYSAKAAALPPANCVPEASGAVSVSYALCALTADRSLSDRLTTPFARGDIDLAISSTSETRPIDYQSTIRR